MNRCVGKGRGRGLVICTTVINFHLPFFVPWRNSRPVGQGVLIIEDSRLHSGTSHSVGLLWTSDQPDEEIST